MNTSKSEPAGTQVNPSPMSKLFQRFPRFVYDQVMSTLPVCLSVICIPHILYFPISSWVIFTRSFLCLMVLAMSKLFQRYLRFLHDQVMYTLSVLDSVNVFLCRWQTSAVSSMSCMAASSSFFFSSCVFFLVSEAMTS